MPTLVGPNDAVILDQHVHASVQMAAALLKASGVHVETLRHSRMDQLESRIQKLKAKFDHIWYMADGVYSMFGDVAPLCRLRQLLDAHSQFHLYVDDAHGFSWTGTRGCGRVLRETEQHERMVVAVSLNKCFGCAGGALVLPTREFQSRVRLAGPTLIFSGPIQPPMLGAALASVKLHLSDSFFFLQAALASLIAYTNERCRHQSVPLADFNVRSMELEPAPLAVSTEHLSRPSPLDSCFTEHTRVNLTLAGYARFLCAVWYPCSCLQHGTRASGRRLLRQRCSFPGGAHGARRHSL